MSLQEQLKTDLKHVMGIKKSLIINNERKSALRVILGEFSRFSKKTITDEDVIKILRKLQKDEKIAMRGGDSTTFLKTVESYLPNRASKEEIEEVISTIDLTKFKNKIQAMGMIMRKLGDRANGNEVKDVLMNM